MGWPGSKSGIPWWPPRPSSRQVAVGIETDRGLPVRALLAAGYQVYAVNPQVVGRYRGRHRAARAKSEPPRD
jgi:transposase